MKYRIPIHPLTIDIISSLVGDSEWLSSRTSSETPSYYVLSEGVEGVECQILSHGALYTPDLWSATYSIPLILVEETPSPSPDRLGLYVFRLHPLSVTLAGWLNNGVVPALEDRTTWFVFGTRDDFVPEILNDDMLECRRGMLKKQFGPLRHLMVLR